ncbi:hypothetical protein HN51_023069, partial [Arachis hypogaea]
MKKLTDLSLNTNQIEGSMSIEIRNLSHLKTFFGQLKNLTQLILDSNQLHGSIPLELGNLSCLTALSLSKDSLIGSIPSFSKLEHHLINLNLNSNKIR